MTGMNTLYDDEVVTVVLRPRPLARCPSGFLLLPLLPQKPVPKPLPSEIWTRILGYVLLHYTQFSRDMYNPITDALKQGLLYICKALTDVILPLYYENIRITTLSSLERFTKCLQTSDQKWDSIRRIPYSTPGRWVQTLDLSELQCSWSESYDADAFISRLLWLLPFLMHFSLNQTIVLSSRLSTSMSSREGNMKLRSLTGIKLTPYTAERGDLVEILRCCYNITEFECFGVGLEITQLPLGHSQWHDIINRPLCLPHLRKLALISMPYSPIMLSLLHSPLPALKHLTLTPYDVISIPTTLVPLFIERHGSALTSLHLYSPKTWPPVLFPSPTTLLQTCPLLHHLSMETPLSNITLCSINPNHPLQILSIPRPDPSFLPILESLLSKLPNLRAVRARDVRWLRYGLSSSARDSGIQGELRIWEKRLGRRGIHLLDGDWQPSKC